MFSIIPAIDIIDWKIVRLSEWNYEEKTFYDKDIFETIKYFENIWLKDLHLVDLIWAREWKVIEWDLIEKILENSSLNVDFGWGIRTREDVKKIIKLWVKYVNIWSLAIKSPEKMKSFIEEFWAESFSIWIDVIWGYCYTNWWKQKSESKYFEILDLYSKLWVKRFNITSILNDWKLFWVNLDLYERIIKNYSKLEIVVSGGVKDSDDIINAKNIGSAGIIVWKAFYEGRGILPPS